MSSPRSDVDLADTLSAQGLASTSPRSDQSVGSQALASCESTGSDGPDAAAIARRGFSSMRAGVDPSELHRETGEDLEDEQETRLKLASNTALKVVTHKPRDSHPLNMMSMKACVDPAELVARKFTEDGLPVTDDGARNEQSGSEIPSRVDAEISSKFSDGAASTAAMVDASELHRVTGEDFSPVDSDNGVLASSKSYVSFRSDTSDGVGSMKAQVDLSELHRNSGEDFNPLDMIKLISGNSTREERAKEQGPGAGASSPRKRTPSPRARSGSPRRHGKPRQPLACAIYGTVAPRDCTIRPVRAEEYAPGHGGVSHAARRSRPPSANPRSHSTSRSPRAQPAVQPEAARASPRATLTDTGPAKSPARPTYTEVGRYMAKSAAARPRPTSGQATRGARKLRSRPKTAVAARPLGELERESRAQHLFLENLVGRVKLSHGDLRKIPCDLTARVPVRKLVQMCAHLEEVEYGLKQVVRREKARAEAEAACLRDMRELLTCVGEDLEHSLPTASELAGAAQQPESSEQARLWLQQARLVCEVIEVELQGGGGGGGGGGQQGNGSPTRSGAVPTNLPHVAFQALQVLCGVSRSFAEACREGLGTAEVLIRKLFEETQAGAAAVADSEHRRRAEALQRQVEAQQQQIKDQQAQIARLTRPT